MNLVDKIRQAFLRARQETAKLDIDPQETFLKEDLSGLPVPEPVKGFNVKTDFEVTIPWPEKGLSGSPFKTDALPRRIDPLDPEKLGAMLRDLKIPPKIFEDIELQLSYNLVVLPFPYSK